MVTHVVAETPTVQTEKIEATGQVGELADRVAGGATRLVLERAGQPVAAVVSMRDLARLRVDDERLAERRRVLDEFAEPFKDIPPDEIQREVDLAIAAVRARRRAAEHTLVGVGTDAAQ